MDCFLTTFWVLDMRFSLTLAHLQRVRGAVETLLSALTPISQAKSHKNKVQPTMMNAYLLSKDEQNISLLLNLLFPLLYQEGVQNTLFRWRRIFGWMLNGLASSVIIFFPLHQSIRPRSIQ